MSHSPSPARGAGSAYWNAKFVVLFFQVLNGWAFLKPGNVLFVWLAAFVVFAGHTVVLIKKKQEQNSRRILSITVACCHRYVRVSPVDSEP
jgi:hypothetical protein